MPSALTLQIIASLRKDADLQQLLAIHEKFRGKYSGDLIEVAAGYWQAQRWADAAVAFYEARNAFTPTISETEWKTLENWRIKAESQAKAAGMTVDYENPVDPETGQPKGTMPNPQSQVASQLGNMSAPAAQTGADSKAMQQAKSPNAFIKSASPRRLLEKHLEGLHDQRTHNPHKHGAMDDAGGGASPNSGMLPGMVQRGAGAPGAKTGKKPAKGKAKSKSPLAEVQTITQKPPTGLPEVNAKKPDIQQPASFNDGSHSGFDTKTWSTKAVPDRVKEFLALPEETRDAMADAPRSIPAAIQERLSFAGQRPADGSPHDAVRSRLKQIGDYIQPDAHALISKHMLEMADDLNEAGVDPEKAREIVLDAVDTLAVQEQESNSRTLGDHGSRHLMGDSQMALDIMTAIPGYETPATRIALKLAGVYHDAGYLTPPSHIFLDKDHPRWSTQHYEKNIQPKIAEALGPDVAEYLKHIIATHADANLDWVNNPVASAFRVADNVALFHKEKLPGFMHYVPDNIQAIAKLGRKEITADQAREECAANIQKADLSEKVRKDLLAAITEINPITAKLTLGMLGGEITGFDWGDDTGIVVKMKRDTSQDDILRVLDLHQKQFAKFAESFGVKADDFLGEKEYEFTQGGTKVMKAVVEGGTEKPKPAPKPAEAPKPADKPAEAPKPAPEAAKPPPVEEKPVVKMLRYQIRKSMRQ